jgi:hypothetical protein
MLDPHKRAYASGESSAHCTSNRSENSRQTKDIPSNDSGIEKIGVPPCRDASLSRPLRPGNCKS